MLPLEGIVSPVNKEKMTAQELCIQRQEQDKVIEGSYSVVCFVNILTWALGRRFVLRQDWGRSCCVTQPGFEPVVLLPLHPKFWDGGQAGTFPLYFLLIPIDLTLTFLRHCRSPAPPGVQSLTPHCVAGLGLYVDQDGWNSQ